MSRNAENWGRKIEKILKVLFNKIIDEINIPWDWYNSEGVLIWRDDVKKEGNTNIKS